MSNETLHALAASVTLLFACFSLNSHANTEKLFYHYDNLNRLTTAETTNGRIQTFVFDEKHNRLSLDKQATSPDAPTANNDHYTVQQDTVLNPTSNGILANDTDPNDQSLSAINVSSPKQGLLNVNPDGSFTYTPKDGFAGQVSFSYQVSNGTQNGNVAVVTIDVLSDNPAPIVRAVDYETIEDTTTILNVLSNSNDPNGDALTIISVDYSGTGQAVIDGQAIAYTPAANFVGTETITYTISDGINEITETLTITVIGENDAPIARVDRVVVTYGKTATILPLANDSDPEGGTLTITAIDYSGDGNVTYTDQVITYALAAGETTDQLTYTVSDEQGLTSTGHIFINLSSNAAPIARDDGSSTTRAIIFEDTTQVLHVLTNDEDPNGDTLSIVSTSTPAHGTVSIIHNDKIVYTPHRNYIGHDSFRYTIEDTQGLSATATVYLNVLKNNTNTRPIAVNDYAYTPPGRSVTIDFLANDSDPNFDALIYVSHTTPTQGTVSLNSARNRFVYTPPSNFKGQATFSYTIRDAGELLSSATVTINVQPLGAIIAPIITFLLDDDCPTGTIRDPETQQCTTEAE